MEQAFRRIGRPELHRGSIQADRVVYPRFDEIREPNEKALLASPTVVWPHAPGISCNAIQAPPRERAKRGDRNPPGCGDHRGGRNRRWNRVLPLEGGRMKMVGRSVLQPCPSRPTREDRSLSGWSPTLGMSNHFCPTAQNPEKYRSKLMYIYIGWTSWIYSNKGSHFFNFDECKCVILTRESSNRPTGGILCVLARPKFGIDNRLSS